VIIIIDNLFAKNLFSTNLSISCHLDVGQGERKLDSSKIFSLLVAASGLRLYNRFWSLQTRPRIAVG
jgi:hypothetical protein